MPVYVVSKIHRYLQKPHFMFSIFRHKGACIGLEREKKQPLVILMLVLLQHGTLFSLSKYFELLWEWILFFHFNIREIFALVIKFIYYFLLIYFFLFFSLNFDRDGSRFKAYTSNLFILFFSYKVLFSHRHHYLLINIFSFLKVILQIVLILWFFLGCPTSWLI